MKTKYDIGGVFGGQGVQGYPGEGTIALIAPITSTLTLRPGQSYANMRGSDMIIAGVNVPHGKVVRIVSVDYFNDTFVVSQPEPFLGTPAIHQSITYVVNTDTPSIPAMRHNDVILCASETPITVYGRQMIKGDLLVFTGKHVDPLISRNQSILGRASSDGGAHIWEAEDA